ncbi:unnamed protein product [Penicillium salamii]|nr:unnamed protein product [Penicillium salamii]CAG8230570.1 unnamed protein product [Penicillium salamii]CAG8397785.1 unnamed protein product [Penicillium salamii]
MVTQTPAWVLNDQQGIESLQLADNPVSTLKDDEVLVKIHAASLNYRDIVIAKGEPQLPFFKPGVTPCSDGSGTVTAVGSQVKSFKVGDRVCTHLVSGLSSSSAPTFTDINSGLGQHYDGTLRKHAMFHESALVPMPPSLSFLEACTLTCSGLTAWNALFGLDGLVPGEGTTVLVQGTGGVSIAALQFAIAAGSTVIATTSTEAKAERLRSLGAHHVIKYRTSRDWGDVAKSLTHGRGVDIVVDVGGLSTLPQSFKAVRTNGLIAVTGLLGHAEDQAAVPTILDCLINVCTARGILLGTRDQFHDMNRFIEDKGIKPVVDEEVFDFLEAKEAYRYLEQQKHFSKVCIRLE